jgi:predicted nucleotidyltransferase
MSRTRVIDSFRSVLEPDERVLLAYVFGSLARGDASDGSDADVAVLAARELSLDERTRLGEQLGRAIGFERPVDLVDLRSASPVLAAEVVRDGERIVERDPLVRFDFEMGAIRRFEDTRGLRKLQQELLREGARGPA